MAQSIRLADGKSAEVPLTVENYREAQDAKMSLPQLINRKYPNVDVEKDGTAFEQLCAASGLLMSANTQLGFRPPTVAEAMSGSVEMMAAGAITKDPSPASRILFPAIAIAATEAALRDDNNSFINLFDSLVSRKESIAGEKFEQPIIDFSAIDDDPPTPMPIAQGAMPHNMPTITASDITRRIPHFSIGLEITEQAQAITSLPLVTATLTRQAEHYRYSIVLDAISAMLNGDADVGFAALPTTSMSTFDAAAVDPANFSHLAWIKYLMNDYKKRQINWVLADFDTAWAIEQRTGRPLKSEDDSLGPRIQAGSRIANPQWENVSLLMVPDGAVPADTLMGMDTRWAMWRVESTTVNYQAVEEFVLRRVTGMRFDMGFMYLRQFDDAFSVATLD